MNINLNAPNLRFIIALCLAIIALTGWAGGDTFMALRLEMRINLSVAVIAIAVLMHLFLRSKPVTIETEEETQTHRGLNLSILAFFVASLLLLWMPYGFNLRGIRNMADLRAPFIEPTPVLLAQDLLEQQVVEHIKKEAGLPRKSDAEIEAFYVEENAEVKFWVKDERNRNNHKDGPFRGIKKILEYYDRPILREYAYTHKNITEVSFNANRSMAIAMSDTYYDHLKKKRSPEGNNELDKSEIWILQRTSEDWRVVLFYGGIPNRNGQNNIDKQLLRTKYRQIKREWNL